MLNNEVFQRRYDILKVKFNLIAYNVVMETIERWRQNREQHYITLTNPHSVMVCNRDTAMLKATEMAGMTLPDGIGIILAAQLLGYPHNGRTTGPTLMLNLCDWGRERGYKHFFYGGAEGVADRLAKQLCQRYPNLQVVGTYCPPFRVLTGEEDRSIILEINSTEPDIVWVGLGAPKQEKWMADHVGKINASAMIGVGAAFDFHSGNSKWAPEWNRKLGLEWAYRLTQDPKRMWRRNIDNPLFVVEVLNKMVKENFARVRHR